MAHTRGSEQGHSPKDEWPKSAGGPPHCSRLGSQDDYRGQAERWRNYPDYPLEAAR